MSAIIIIDNKPTEVSDDGCREIMRLRSENAALREILINADELERYSGSDGRREWGKCSTWLHADDAVIIVSAKAFDAIRKEM